MVDDNDEFELENEAPSKSALKREMTALQELGEALCALSPAELEKIPIEDATLLEAIHESRRIQKHGALRRHRQFIGGAGGSFNDNRPGNCRRDQLR